MIDTDKYEGHTPAPWGRDCDCLFEYDGEYIAKLALGNEANAQLIEDAPKLLAEIKRLRKQLSEAEDVIQIALDHTDDEDDKRLFEDFLGVKE